MNLFKSNYPLISSLTTYDNNYKFDDDLISRHTVAHKEKINAFENNELFSRYFGSILHDSPIIQICNDKDLLQIKVNDYQCFDFASETCHAFGIKVPRKKLIFPLTLKFHHPKIQLSRINKNDKLIYVNKTKYIPKLAYWLHDEFQFISEKNIKVGILAEKRPCKGNKGELLLEVDSSSIEAHEEQKESYLNIFGKAYLQYWNRFREQWKSQGYLAHEDMVLILSENNK
ncbi:MAG: hypothetical protein OEM02_17100 [Desulfobulbaceae bacterium]|nr:hypothetical protein [Desulfobulbaceae bacterium]